MSDPSNNPAEEWITSELVQEDPDFIDLVEEFVASLDDRLSDLQAALAKQDVQQLRNLAHQLKGAGGGHGLPDGGTHERPTAASRRREFLF